MSIAIKCDRCKKLFEPKINRMGYAKTYVRLSATYNSPISVIDKIFEYDLCNECAEELKKWISMGEMKGERNENKNC